MKMPWSDLLDRIPPELREAVTPTLIPLFLKGLPLWSQIVKQAQRVGSWPQAMASELGPSLRSLYALSERDPSAFIERFEPVWMAFKALAAHPAIQGKIHHIAVDLMDIASAQIERFFEWLSSPDSTAQVGDVINQIEAFIAFWLERHGESLFK